MQNKKLTYTLEEAKKRLERYCIYQDRCHDEIEAKLKEMNMIPEASEVIILYLMEHDFLNEERFSKSFARGKFKIKHWGKQRIIRELKRRKISTYNMDTALKEIDDDDYFSTIKEIAFKRYEKINEQNRYKKNKKLIDFLLYKGYESNLVYEVVSDISKK